MNAAQRRRAFRTLKREWPLGTLVTHWYETGEHKVVGYTRDLLRVDVMPGGRDADRFPFGYSLKPHQMTRVQRTFLVPVIFDGPIA